MAPRSTSRQAPAERLGLDALFVETTDDPPDAHCFYLPTPTPPIDLYTQRQRGYDKMARQFDDRLTQYLGIRGTLHREVQRSKRNANRVRRLRKSQREPTPPAFSYMPTRNTFRRLTEHMTGIAAHTMSSSASRVTDIAAQTMSSASRVAGIAKKKMATASRVAGIAKQKMSTASRVAGNAAKKVGSASRVVARSASAVVAFSLPIIEAAFADPVPIIPPPVPELCPDCGYYHAEGVTECQPLGVKWWPPGSAPVAQPSRSFRLYRYEGYKRGRKSRSGMPACDSVPGVPVPCEPVVTTQDEVVNFRDSAICMDMPGAFEVTEDQPVKQLSPAPKLITPWPFVHNGRETCVFVNQPEGCSNGDSCSYSHHLAGQLCEDQHCSGRRCIYSHKPKSILKRPGAKGPVHGRSVKFNDWHIGPTGSEMQEPQRPRSPTGGKRLRDDDDALEVVNTDPESFPCKRLKTSHKPSGAVASQMQRMRLPANKRRRDDFDDGEFDRETPTKRSRYNDRTL